MSSLHGEPCPMAQRKKYLMLIWKVRTQPTWSSLRDHLQFLGSKEDRALRRHSFAPGWLPSHHIGLRVWREASVWFGTWRTQDAGRLPAIVEIAFSKWCYLHLIYVFLKLIRESWAYYLDTIDAHPIRPLQPRNKLPFLPWLCRRGQHVLAETCLGLNGLTLQDVPTQC